MWGPWVVTGPRESAWVQCNDQQDRQAPSRGGSHGLKGLWAYPHYPIRQNMRSLLGQDQVQRAHWKYYRSCQKTNNNQSSFTNLEIPWGFLAQDILCRLGWGLCHARWVQAQGLCEKDAKDWGNSQGCSKDKSQVEGHIGRLICQVTLNVCVQPHSRVNIA